VPVVVEGETVPPADTAPGRNSFIGDVLVKAIPKLLQDLSSSQRCDS
jgi:hypothetical protein